MEEFYFLLWSLLALLHIYEYYFQLKYKHRLKYDSLFADLLIKIMKINSFTLILLTKDANGEKHVSFIKEILIIYNTPQDSFEQVSEILYQICIYMSRTFFQSIKKNLWIKLFKMSRYRMCFLKSSHQVWWQSEGN